MKSINLALLQKRFPEFVPCIYKTMVDVNDLIRLWRQISTLPTMFDHYCGQGSKQEKFCLFVYMCIINIYLCKLMISGDIKFIFCYLNNYTHMQRHFT